MAIAEKKARDLYMGDLIIAPFGREYEVRQLVVKSRNRIRVQTLMTKPANQDTDLHWTEYEVNSPVQVRALCAWGASPPYTNACEELSMEVGDLCAKHEEACQAMEKIHNLLYGDDQ